MSSRIAKLRQNASGLAIEAFFRGLSASAKLHPRAREVESRLEIARDIPYRSSDDSAHLLDVYRPKGARGPLPVVLHVHGGGFRILSKDTHWLMGLAFADRGYVVFNINYRLAPAHTYPAALEDACDAYRWVVEHAHEYGGDISRLFLAGESAGANLITGLTIATCFERHEPYARSVRETGVRPIATMPFCGLLEAGNLDRYRGRVPQIVQDRMDQIEVAYLGPGPRDRDTLADPLVVLESDARPVHALPPFFAPCGTGDPVLEDTVRLSRALEKRGVRHHSPHYEREPHAFHAFVFRRNARRCWRDAFAFMDDVLDQAG